jgi:hypothetical protein
VEIRKRRTPQVMKTLAVAASLVVVLGSASVAGATTASTPKKWVSTMCGTFLTWEQAAKTGDAKLQKVLNQLQKSGNTNLAPIRAQLVAFLGAFSKASQTARGRMVKVGAPSVKHGAQIHAAVVKAFATSATFLAHAKASVAKFPTNDAKAFIAKANALTASINKTFTQVGNSLSALSKYKATQLEAAAKADPACKKLAG